MKIKYIYIYTFPGKGESYGGSSGMGSSIGLSYGVGANWAGGNGYGYESGISAGGGCRWGNCDGGGTVYGSGSEDGDNYER